MDMYVLELEKIYSLAKTNFLLLKKTALGEKYGKKKLLFCVEKKSKLKL